jgi:hypothetical protein
MALGHSGSSSFAASASVDDQLMPLRPLTYKNKRKNQRVLHWFIHCFAWASLSSLLLSTTNFPTTAAAMRPYHAFKRVRHHRLLSFRSFAFTGTQQKYLQQHGYRTTHTTARWNPSNHFIGNDNRSCSRCWSSLPDAHPEAPPPPFQPDADPKHSLYEHWVRRLYMTNMFNPVKLGLENIEKIHSLMGNPMDDVRFFASLLCRRGLMPCT